MIKDSGARAKFDTGAVRDIREGKGRCDLLPLNMVDVLLEDESVASGTVISNIDTFQETHKWYYLIEAAKCFMDEVGWTTAHAVLEVSIHFEEGAKKYGDNNWRKGIPVRCYVDSALRHYFKWLDGMTDESHDRAVIWNLLCGAWTQERNDRALEEEDCKIQ